MYACALCGREVRIGRYFSRKASCPHCGRDLHICLNCAFYSETSHNKCIEPKAEHQRSRDRANFCDYFRFRGAVGPSKGTGNASDEARNKFEELFRK